MTERPWKLPSAPKRAKPSQQGIEGQNILLSALPPDMCGATRDVRYGPCVDGSRLARRIFTNAALVGAAMCSAC
jgi:hypothetical protein